MPAIEEGSSADREPMALAPAQAHPTQNTLWRYAIRKTGAMGAAVSVSTSSGSGQARGSSSATTGVQEVAEAEGPLLHSCQYDHFQEQSGAWCGMHALNNLLRGPMVDKDACKRAARVWHKVRCGWEAYGMTPNEVVTHQRYYRHPLPARYNSEPAL